ncbi:hypothetical protein EJB05_36313, partial [Eragrostis curvula]
MESGGLLCDDALVEILVRLPAVAVLRCRSVCKRWLRIATDPSFLAAHAAHRPSEMIIRSHFEPSEVRTLLLSPDRKARRDSRFLCHRQQQQQGETDDGRRGFDVLYSLDGLLVLMQRSGLYIICNPTTRQWTNFPVLAPEPCSDASVCGFYFHSSSGEYRLRCHGAEKDHDSVSDGRRRNRCYYYILSAGGTLPRRIGRAPDDPIISSSITVDDFEPPVLYRGFIHWLTAQAEAARNKRVVFYELPVAHRGLLHWFSVHPEAARTGKMLAFDTVAETFRLMSRPPERAGDMMRSLLELDGELCVAAMQKDLMSLDIWALEGSESWTLCHRVQVPLTCLYRNNATVTKVISIASGIILIGDPVRASSSTPSSTHLAAPT